MYDKGKAAWSSPRHRQRPGRWSPLYTNLSSAFIRGEGGWGGDRGPSGPQNVPPDRAPDQEVTYQTSPDQALIYRLSGDRNPLHSDPSFAAMGGFDRPILHGLCCYGFTGRALLHSLCDSDAWRFQHIEGRFASPVLPGEALTWRCGHGRRCRRVHHLGWRPRGDRSGFASVRLSLRSAGLRPPSGLAIHPGIQASLPTNSRTIGPRAVGSSIGA